MITCEVCGRTDIQEIIETHDCKGANGPRSNVQTGLEKENGSNNVINSQRPDGAFPTFIGRALIVVGLVIAIFSTVNMYVADSTYGGEADYMRYWSYVVYGSAFVSLGTLFWSVGYIVHAMSFLQGRD